MPRLLCFADLHGNFDAAKSIEKLAGEYDILIGAGDITHFYSAEVAKAMLHSFIKSSKKFLAVPGNCDLKATLELMESLDISLHGRGKIAGNLGFFGIGGSNKTPFNTPLEFDEAFLAQLLEEGYKEAEGADFKILVSHTPPYGILDLAPSGEHIGSKAVREFLDKNEVNLVVCGHAHEAKGTDKIKNTLVINTSPAKKWLLDIEIKSKEVKYDFISP